MSDTFKKAWETGYLSAGNMAYVDGLYEDYLANAQSVSKAWQDVFNNLSSEGDDQSDVSHRALQAYFLDQARHPKALMTVTATGGQDDKQARVTHLIQAYRSYGHLVADLDPLKMVARERPESLERAYHGLDSSDLSQVFSTGGGFSEQTMPLEAIEDALKQTYCGSIGIEYMHIVAPEEVSWIQNKMESARGQLTLDANKKKEVLDELIAADGLERYLATRYVGQKRFSLEGGDALVPMMNELIREAGQHEVREVIVGMAHRGRLNVLVNVLGKDPKQLFQEFEGKIKLERTGDVKYHLGFSSDLKTTSGDVVHVALAFNPSHLEIIGPVVQGSARSRLRRRHDLAEKKQVLPIVIHGDAAFAGQGVVMETFNFSQARGYCTGGTVHVVVNNQIGFTTSNPLDARSTLYCTDVAKMVQAPVIHVNGDSPEAVIFATRLAFEFRMKFKRDVVLDLVCYRRHGHNEADEPSVTQPLMYQKIKTVKSLRELYAIQLIAEGFISDTDVTHKIDAYRDKLDRGEAVVQVVHGDYKGKVAVDWTPYFDTPWNIPVNTSVDLKTLQTLSTSLEVLPEGFQLHPVVKRLLAERHKMALGEISMNWGYAETMAYATLLNEGYGVRLSGQDCRRGTFAHRHAALHDMKTGEVYVPLEHVASDPTNPALIIDSVLSEEAVLAFEYGYASSEPHYLVLWEAQFGDFANGAQVVIDQFISSGEQKWGRLSGLVMLLPHGYEGQGPEHSSARLERYMQLCAQQNMQVCIPTTPSQIFHLLRRQLIRPFRKPLIVMTPKSLLRHKLAVSPLSDLVDGMFHTVIPEVDPLKPDAVNRVVLCSGKVYYDLLQRRREENQDNAVIIRVEQLYPFPKQELSKELLKYPKATRVIWCQEEPKNQGVWFSSQHHIAACLVDKQTLEYAGRGFAASPAVGSASLHIKEQNALIEQALLK
jgi:2-oxoglutarate dehydrogenase E1 component